MSTLECAPVPPATTEDDRSIADRVYFVWNTFVPVRLATPGGHRRRSRHIFGWPIAGRMAMQYGVDTECNALE
ncbi:MAG: hypothetical protein OXD42_11950, partial [Rhodospirillaceae bacterium]|nr:hypothetical protein [Rhodospirillaceae bacterium]